MSKCDPVQRTNGQSPSSAAGSERSAEAAVASAPQGPKPKSPPRPANSRKDQEQGQTVTLEVREPWPEAVDGAQLLDDIEREVRRYVVLTPNESAALALWVVASHAFAAFDIFPKLLIKSPEPECGKSTLLRVIRYLVNRPISASNTTAAVMFRLIEMASKENIK